MAAAKGISVEKDVPRNQPTLGADKHIATPAAPFEEAAARRARTNTRRAKVFLKVEASPHFASGRDMGGNIAQRNTKVRKEVDPEAPLLIGTIVEFPPLALIAHKQPWLRVQLVVPPLGFV